MTGAPRASAARVARDLARRDRVLAGLVERYGPPRLGARVPVEQRFAVLARAILYQQLAGGAARAIHGRFVAALGGEVSPERVLAAGPEALAAAGLSRAKAAAVRDLAEKVITGEVALAGLGRQPDDEVVAHLVRVRGIGRWTAEMFLLSSLRRPDVWPVDDFGVRAGYARAWSLGALPSPAELAPLGERFRPFRSTVAWYCWRAADEPKPDATTTGRPGRPRVGG